MTKKHELDFFKDFTFDKFVDKYFPLLILLVQNGVCKDNMRKTIKVIISLQTDKTKENLFKEMPKRNTERKLVNWMFRAIEQFRKVEK